MGKILPISLKLNFTPNTMWVASLCGFSEMKMQPARHECHACCLLRARFLAFQPVVDNTRGTRVEQVVSSFQKILRGSQLTWYFGLLRVNTNFQSIPGHTAVEINLYFVLRIGGGQWQGLPNRLTHRCSQSTIKRCWCGREILFGKENEEPRARCFVKLSKSGVYLRHNFGFLDKIIFRHRSLLHHLDGHVNRPSPFTPPNHSELARPQLFHQHQLLRIYLPFIWNNIN